MAPFHTSFSRLSGALLLVSGLLAGCPGSGLKNLKDDCPGSGCDTDNQCTQQDTYCDSSKPNTNTKAAHKFCCRTTARECGEGVDAGIPTDQQQNPCCPGQECSDLAGLCADKVTGCTADTDCNVAAGQYCETSLTKFPKGSAGCTFHSCDNNGNCGPGLGCFNGYCVAAPPCSGHCDQGSVCVPASNTCYTLGANASATCSMSCGSGNLLVFKDGHNVFATCNHALTNECECLSFPNIQTADAARFSAATIAGDKILVSAYDGDHGDLILRTFRKTDQKEVDGSPEWIDGVPESGTIVGNVNGPRKGISDPGPDVGRYTSIAYDADKDTTHIAYYAVADGTTALGNLKYARRKGTEPWVVMTVDGQAGSTDTGDVGLYTSIAVAKDHSPVIAYFQKAGVGADLVKTGLKIARGKNATPGANDWSISFVETGTRPAPPCGGQMCPSNQVCSSVGDHPDGICAPKAASSACSPACSGSKVCVTYMNASSCQDTLTASNLAALPEGNGLMPSLAYLDDLPVVVWYDHNANALKGALATADSASGVTFGNVQLLDDGSTPGNATAALHDVGRFPSLAIGPASAAQRIAVAYMDSTTKQLRLVTAKADWSNQTALDKRVIDNGVSTGADASLFVGANASLKFAGDTLALAYQDSTGTTLRIAGQANATAPVQFSQTVASPPGPKGDRPLASGFYANMVVDGTARYATHATLYARDKSQAQNTLQVVKLP